MSLLGVVACTLAWPWPGASAHGDVLTLRDGQELQGMILEVDDTRILFRLGAEPGGEPRPVLRSEVTSIRLSTPDVSVLRRSAESLESSRLLEESVEAWRVVCALSPESAADQVRLARALRRVGRFEEAAAKAQAAAKASPRDPRIPAEQGEIALCRGNPNEAIGFARELFRLEGPGSQDGNWLQGRACEASFQVDDALSAYRMILRADPARSGVLERFIDCALAHGKDGVALEAAEGICRAQPGLRAGWLAVGMVRYRQGRYEEAAGAFQSATAQGGPGYDRARIFLQCARARREHRDPRSLLGEADLEEAGRLDLGLRRDKP